MDHRLLLVVQRGLERPAAGRDLLDADAAFLGAGKPDLGVELQQCRLGRRLLGRFTLAELAASARRSG